MPSLYLIDLFNDRLVERRPLVPSQPLDVTGRYGVVIPDGVDVGNPSDVASLTTAKVVGLYTNYGFFTNFMFDDMRTSSNIDTTASVGVSVSPKVGVAMQPPVVASSVLLSTTQMLGGTPSQVLFTWDAFYYQDTDVKAGRFQRSFVLPQSNDPEANVTCDLSFDNGSTFTTVTNRQLTIIPPANQGSNLIVRFTRSSGSTRLFIGSWAILYL